MGLFREKITYLRKWKEKSYRKPLILRGARQVGKTTLIRDFGKEYEAFIHLNLEKSKDAEYFKKSDDVSEIAYSIFLSNNTSFDKREHTLLFIDEIQEVPKAIQLLRYFYEEIPNLHVIAAGSLLEFALGDVISFPVGRVEFLYLHPFNFREYLIARGKEVILKELDTVPLQKFAESSIMTEFHQYAIIGGMPEIVKNFVETNDVTILPEIYESIWTSYKSDIEKYANSASHRKVLQHVVNSAPTFLDERIKYQNFGKSNYKSREISEAFSDLSSAKVIQLIYPTTSTELPIIPDFKKSPRMQILDTGLVNHSLNIAPKLILQKDLSESYRGALLPHLITQEIISLQTIKAELPNFWVREKSQSSSELDLVLPFENYIIPIEFKSGKIGKLRSLHQFMERTTYKHAVRMYAGTFNVEKVSTPNGKEFYLMNLPYFLGTKIHDYIKYFVENYK